MAKVRVHELAKELGVESKVVLAKLKEMGEFVKSASSTVEPPVVKRFADTFGEELKAASGWGPTAKVASVAMAWAVFARLMEEQGAATVADVDRDLR